MKNFYFYTEQMCVGYRNQPIIKEIEISLAKGEILTLIGPNGAGKSTVLKSIAGQLKLMGGAVYLGREDLTKIKGNELAKKMSVMFTEQLRTEMMTCEDVVATGRYPYTGYFGVLTEKDRDVVDEVMKLVHITEIGKQDFRCISDGQRQRVMLARAICQEPEILVLDEPTSYLDVKYKLEFLSVLQEMREKRGLTVILSLHELELAKRVSDKILCLKGVYVQKYGTPEEIFQSGYIGQLFEITDGSFDEKSGGMELAAPKGEADLFVIAGDGSGGMVYHKLQRKGRAFVTGILYKNDLDYPIARALAEEVISAEAFEPIKPESLERAKRAVDSCRQVVCCRKRFGSFESANQELFVYAGQRRKLITIEEL